MGTCLCFLSCASSPLSIIEGVLAIKIGDKELTDLWMGHLEERERTDSTAPTYANLRTYLLTHFVAIGGGQVAMNQLLDIRQKHEETMESYLLRADRLRLKAGADAKGDGTAIIIVRRVLLGVSQSRYAVTYASAKKEVDSGRITNFGRLRALLAVESHNEPHRGGTSGSSDSQSQSSSSANSSKHGHYSSKKIRIAALKREAESLGYQLGSEDEEEEEEIAVSQVDTGVNVWCGRCKETKHPRDQCKLKEDRICHICKVKGHLAASCPKKSSPTG